MLLIAAALAIWWTLSHSPRAALALTIYAAVNLAGAMVTVLPFGWLPFAPEQSVAHYAAHVIYALCQVPLLAVGGSLLTGDGNPRLPLPWKPFETKRPDATRTRHTPGSDGVDNTSSSDSWRSADILPTQMRARRGA
jgi:hypothetical protein